MYRIVAGHLGLPLIEVSAADDDDASTTPPGAARNRRSACSAPSAQAPAATASRAAAVGWQLTERAALPCPAPPCPALACRTRLPQMSYAELLWLDARGLYVRAEALGRPPAVVRVPFYRPVLDERDARSVLTMASHINWEAERQYTPPPVASPAAAGSSSSN